MAIGQWLVENWFEVLSTLGIAAGLWFSGITLRSEEKTRRVANLLTITANHREIWKECFANPALFRVLAFSVDLKKHPVTPLEHVFVNMVILHVSSVYYARRDDRLVDLEGFRQDISRFFTLPVPQAVWTKTKQFQNAKVVAFVEGCLEREA